MSDTERLIAVAFVAAILPLTIAGIVTINTLEHLWKTAATRRRTRRVRRNWASVPHSAQRRQLPTRWE